MEPPRAIHSFNDDLRTAGDISKKEIIEFTSDILQFYDFTAKNAYF